MAKEKVGRRARANRRTCLLAAACAFLAAGSACAQEGASETPRGTSGAAPWMGQATVPPLVPIALPAPPYPPMASRFCISGVVNFDFVVAPDGHVAEVLILDSPDVSLSRAVRDTVAKRWRYQPLRSAGGAWLFSGMARKVRSSVRFGAPLKCDAEETATRKAQLEQLRASHGASASGGK